MWHANCRYISEISPYVRSGLKFRATEWRSISFADGLINYWINNGKRYRKRRYIKFFLIEPIFPLPCFQSEVLQGRGRGWNHCPFLPFVWNSDLLLSSPFFPSECKVIVNGAPCYWQLLPRQEAQRNLSSLEINSKRGLYLSWNSRGNLFRFDDVLKRTAAATKYLHAALFPSEVYIFVVRSTFYFFFFFGWPVVYVSAVPGGFSCPITCT